MNLKGLPAFIMNQVLKRHPLALFYIRIQLTDPPNATCNSPTRTDEEISELNTTVDKIDFTKTIQ